MSRIEDLIVALLNGESVRFEPHSRMEAYFLSCITSGGVEGLPNPVSRLDILLYQLAEVLSNGGAVVVDDTQTYMLVMNDGTEIPAVLVDEQTVFTATANDIREGRVAATEDGVTMGTKDIPSYYTHEGKRFINAGSKFTIPISDYDYTRFQAIITPYNTSMSNSVSAEKVVIENEVYNVLSTEIVSVVVKDGVNERIDLGITNDSENLYVLRYFMYKEIY